MSEATATPKTYLIVFAILLFLTLITVLVARLDLGRLNTVVALAIAFSKALLVILYFMHLKYSTRLTWVVAAGSFYWLGILFLLTMGDYLTRG
ncbi:MAG TPA: cytochrome C oxidase subunit IV family protein [Candidatus Acidoferrales bacterium]|nr:cytochrome C oxidase subunit IV family protein [Candidatus Acidoferrales bacterium]